MTYIACFFHAFSSMGRPALNMMNLADHRFVLVLIFIYVDQAETVSRRVEKFAELMQSVWMSKNDYERRIRAVSPNFDHFIAHILIFLHHTASFRPLRNTIALVGFQIYGHLHGCKRILI